MASLIPPCVRNMTVLDRALFARQCSVPVLAVNERNVSPVINLVKKYFFKLNDFKPVRNSVISEGVNKKDIYLNPEKITKWNDFLEDERNKLIQNSVNENDLSLRKVTLTYDNWRFEDIFKAVLPEGEEVVSGFSQVGHIVHLNLRDRLLSYKYLIGQVLVDKLKICRTVVNKSATIDNTYRNFAMEVIGGEDDFNVTVKESNCTFQFDFSKVYWNTRLQKEHERILQLLKPGDVLFDVFCGVGPFAVPAAKKKCVVFANDLNPDSYKWLNHNRDINKIKSEYFKSFNMDGKDFIEDHFKNYLVDVYTGKIKLDSDVKIHVTMNLPGMAVDFLEHFNGLLKDVSSTLTVENVDIVVHVYTFAYGDYPETSALVSMSKKLGMTLSSDKIVHMVDVRNVAPKKEMVRVSFKLLKPLLIGEYLCDINESEPPLKKKCT